MAALRLAPPLLQGSISLVNATAGARLLISAFWLADSTAAAYDEALTVGAVLALALLSFGASDAAARSGAAT